MAQHDLVIDNAAGSTVRSDINGAFAALGSTMKGTGAPPSPLSGQQWVEDDSPSATVWTWRIYDGADWISVGQVDTTNNRFTPNGIFAAGSASSPGMTPAGDSDTGLWAPSVNTLALSTNGTERMRLTSAGFLGIGITSPSDMITASRSDGAISGIRAENLNVSGGFPRVLLYDVRGSADARKLDIRNAAGVFQYGVLNDAETVFTEKFRVTTGGNLLVGTSADDGTTNGIALVPGADSRIHITSGAGSRFNVAFYKVGGTLVGGIATNDSSTTYGTSSDYRIKRDLVDLDSATAAARLRALRPLTGRFISESASAPARPMFLAHEYAAIAPHAVHGEKDGEAMQFAQYDPLSPVFTAAIVALLDEVAALKARVIALEAVV
jgi:hypothetical protein